MESATPTKKKKGGEKVCIILINLIISRGHIFFKKFETIIFRFFILLRKINVVSFRNN